MIGAQTFSWRDDPHIFRFIGRDGSMGYRTGEVYRLNVIWFDKEDYLAHNPNKLGIERTGWKRLIHGHGRTPYETEQAFWNNWEVAR